METIAIQSLIETYHRKINKIDLKFKRYLYSQINWKARIISIKGARGVGKTTMLLQHILETYDNIDDTLYVSLDDLWFANQSLLDLVDWAYRHGIKRLYLDEVHRYALWSESLKNIYDNYPDMSIVYTGSSLLLIDHGKVDLSRRQTSYTLYGMSFREFLAYNEVVDTDAFSLEDLLSNHVKYAIQIARQTAISYWFEKYLQHGYYPFYNEEPEDFNDRLRETVNAVLDFDLPAVENMSFETIQKVKKLLMLISSNVPFQPKMSELWRQLATHNELGLKMLYTLNKAQILALLSSEAHNYKKLHKPDKIFLDNPNLMYALCPKVNKGNERETFFYNQLKIKHNVSCPQTGDFIIDDRWLFEVGGKKKSFDQIADIPDSYLAIDDIESGYGNRIPLWLFGFLY